MERGWERRRRGRGRNETPQLSDSDRAAIEAIRRELDLEFGHVDRDVADEGHDDYRRRPPWAFLITLTLLVVATAGALGAALYARRAQAPELASRTTAPVGKADVPPSAAAPASSNAPAPASTPAPSERHPESPAEPAPAPAVAPAVPESASARGLEEADGETSGEETATAVAEPPALPPAPERRASRAPESEPAAPTLHDQPARPALPPFDYAKRRPLLPPPPPRELVKGSEG